MRVGTVTDECARNNVVWTSSDLLSMAFKINGLSSMMICRIHRGIRFTGHSDVPLRFPTRRCREATLFPAFPHRESHLRRRVHRWR